MFHSGFCIQIKGKMILIVSGIVLLLVGIGLTIGGVVVWIRHRKTTVPKYTWALLGIGIALLLIGGGLAIWGMTRKTDPSSAKDDSGKTTQQSDLVFGMNV